MSLLKESAKALFTTQPAKTLVLLSGFLIISLMVFMSIPGRFYHEGLLAYFRLGVAAIIIYLSSVAVCAVFGITVFFSFRIFKKNVFGSRLFYQFY